MPPRAARLQQNKSRASPAISVADTARRNANGDGPTSSAAPKKRTAAAAGMSETTNGTTGKRKRVEPTTEEGAKGKGSAKVDANNAAANGDGGLNGDEVEDGKSLVRACLGCFIVSS